ncbi:hypothetical protein [Stutzerimonas xanthomarina]|uniref:hypothetical protein n=1 Tax=Stutzerimonas xanthomarina TaxID=271420 RepID=UPI003AA7CA90
MSILATIFAAAYLPSLPQRMALEHQVSTAILSAGVLLALGLVIALVFIWPNEQRAAANRGSQ